MSWKDEIRRNMNEYGGGLAVNLTGKYESNRHALAKMNDNKRTAGECAQSLRKKGYQVKHTDIKPYCEEWHHAGFIPKYGMKKTYFTKKTDEHLIQLLGFE